MKRTVLIIGWITAAVLLTSSGERGVNSNGAPLASTGAPLENTCAKGGCHTGSGVNSGSALLAISSSEGNGSFAYEPGKTYQFTISLTQPSIERFGFQFLALKNSNGESAGTLAVTDSSRTQVLTGVNAFSGRYYMTYKYPGTAPYSQGVGQWSFAWTAPNIDVGDITLYAAGVAANNDGTDYGDSVYTRQLVLHAAVTGVDEVSAKSLNLAVYPNPAHGQLQLNYNCVDAGETQICLIDISGRITQTLLSRYDNSGACVVQPDVSSYAPGIYLLTLEHGGYTISKKIIVE